MEINNLEKCYITDLPIKNFNRKLHYGKYSIDYEIEFEGRTYFFTFCENCFDQTIVFIEKNKEVLTTLVLNNQMQIIFNDEKDWKNIDQATLHKRHLEKLLKEWTVLTNPQEIKDNLLIDLGKRIKYQGSQPNIDMIKSKQFFLKNYLKNEQEFNFYFRTLEKQGLLQKYEYKKLEGKENEKTEAYSLTYEGLLSYLELTEIGTNSKKCFVAMSFDEEDKPIFQEAIYPICKELGFEAIRVDFEHPNMDETINDLIISEIKKSNFCISDFTKMKAGVYFEAGYASGRGKKVIYTCRKDYFEKLHFDINHYPIIIYENLIELKDKLKAKIEAYIID